MEAHIFLKYVPVRSSKVESFLRNNYNVNARYYETCFVDTKGTPIVRYAVLTEDALLLTENPPKKVIQIIDFSDIVDISLVGDQVKSNNNNNNATPCQHICIVFRQSEKYIEDNTKSTTGDDSYGSVSENGTTTFGEIYSVISSADESSSFNSSSTFEYPDEGAIPLPSSVINLYTPPIRHYSTKNGDKQKSKLSQTLNEKSLSSSVPRRRRSLNLSDFVDTNVFNRPTETEAKTARILSFLGHSETEASLPNEYNKPKGWRNKIRNLFGSNGTLNQQIMNGEISTPKKKSNKLEKQKSLVELNLFVYQAESLLLNELYLLWTRCSTMAQIGTRAETISQKGRHQNWRAAGKLLTKLCQEWKPIYDVVLHRRKDLRFTQLNSKLYTFHRCLEKYVHLKKLCWEKEKIIVIMLTILEHTCEELKTGLGNNGVIRKGTEGFHSLIFAYILLMDIFRFFLQACSTSIFFQHGRIASQTMSNDTIFASRVTNEAMDANDLMSNGELHFREMMRILMRSCSEKSPSSFVCFLMGENATMLSSPQAFVRWNYESGQTVICDKENVKVLKLVSISHNVSAAVFHEMVTLIQFAPRNSTRTKFMRDLQNCSFDLFVTQCVSQITNLLWCDGRMLNEFESNLLFCHLNVLKTLVFNLDNVKSLMGTSFSEEFRYFVHKKSAKIHVPDDFPAKSKILESCDEIRAQVLNSSGK